MVMKKENVKYNSTPATIFIGCGGIGSDIVARVAELCHGDEAERIRFVVLDTNANDLKKVVKGSAEITSIQTSSTQNILDSLKNDEDARRTWFPNNTTLYPKTVSEGAGQVRAISRLAMNTTIKIGHIQRLYREIDNLFLKDGGEFKQALRVVIVSSAAGGTGSGIAMMVGMMVRQYLHQHYREKSALIRGFLLLPGVMDSGTIRTQSERQSLRRNGYATIKEINAFMMNASGFCGVRRELSRFRDIHVDVPTADNDTERLSALPFDFCFLLDRVDNQQESMQTLEQYKAFAAQSLYEQNIGAMQACSFSMEDNIIKEFANAENLGRNRFGGIGSSVLRYPYEEIADYVAYTRAMERIGGGSEASDWSKYDKKYKEEFEQFKKKRGLTADKEPNRGAIYVAALNNDEHRFGQDIKRELAPMGNVSVSAPKQADSLLNNIFTEILSSFTSLPAISSKQSAVESYKKVIDYKNDGGASGTGSVKLSNLRAYETQVKKEAYSFAKAKAQAMFFDSPNIKGTAVKPFHIESVLTAPGGSIHPNAVRYMLYLVQQKMEEQHQAAKVSVDEMNEKLKKIAGKYYLGDMLGETGSTYACKLPGYFRNAKVKVDPPKQGASDMREAKENYSAVLKDFVERERETGVSNVSTVEATMLNNYNVEMGVDMPFSELLCGDPELIVPALRGAARAYDSKLWGTYVAHEWYGGMRHFDKLKDARLELIYKYAYMSGSEAFCLESGLDRITAYGADLPDENPISLKNRELFYRICDYIDKDERPFGGPITRVAFIQGNYDAFGGGWGGSDLWSQFEG